jgi:hypothetical protein
MGLLYVGTNIFVRNEKKMMYEIIESRKCSTKLSVYKSKQAGDEKWKKTHKSITTTPPLNSDAMSSDDSKDKRNNATTKLGGEGYLYEDDYQSLRNRSQGKTICKGMRDETKVAQKRGCGSWKINSTNWKRTIKNWRQNLRCQRNQTVDLWKKIFGMHMIG